MILAIYIPLTLPSPLGGEGWGEGRPSWTTWVPLYQNDEGQTRGI